MTKAVIYARYSSHGQNEQSIEGQLRDAYAYAEKCDYQVIGEYIDRALSGTKDARPDFQRLIRDAEKRLFSIVIVWKLDRFARNRYDSAIYKAKLKKSGVRVVSVMEKITDSPEGIILEGLLESMAEYYSANLAENVRRGQRESVSKGRYIGGTVSYGYRVQDHRLVPDEREAPIAREILQRYASGERLKDIAADLNARGLRSRSGRPFTYASFVALVENPVYIGQRRYQDELVDGYSEPLIDRDTYDRAARRRAANRLAPAAAKAPVRYQLHGHVFCGLCGYPMNGLAGSRKGKVYHYYYCQNHKKRLGCQAKTEPKERLERVACELTLEYILDPAQAGEIAAAVAREYRHEFGDGQTADLQRQIARINADLDKLVDSLLTVPASARARVGERMEQLERQKSDLEIDLAKLRAASRIQISEHDVLAWLATFRGGNVDDLDFRQKLIDDFVNSLYVYPDRYVLFYNLRDRQETITKSDIDRRMESLDLEGGGLPGPNKSKIKYVFVSGVVGIVVER